MSAAMITRDDLLELLLVERHLPHPRPASKTGASADEPVEVDDSELTTRRRRRELYEALTGHKVDDLTTAEGVALADVDDAAAAGGSKKAVTRR